MVLYTSVLRIRTPCGLRAAFNPDSALSAGGAADVSDADAAVSDAVAQDSSLQPHGSPPPAVLGVCQPGAVPLLHPHRHETASSGHSPAADSVAGRTRSRTVDSRTSHLAASRAKVQTASSATAATPSLQRPAAQGDSGRIRLAMLSNTGVGTMADAKSGAPLPQLQYILHDGEPLLPGACHIIVYQQVRIVGQLQLALRHREQDVPCAGFLS